MPDITDLNNSYRQDPYSRIQGNARGIWCGWTISTTREEFWERESRVPGTKFQPLTSVGILFYLHFVDALGSLSLPFARLHQSLGTNRVPPTQSNSSLMMCTSYGIPLGGTRCQGVPLISDAKIVHLLKARLLGPSVVDTPCAFCVW